MPIQLLYAFVKICPMCLTNVKNNNFSTIHLSTTTSTQDELISLINSNNLFVPTAIIAEKQTNGRGRNGKTWISSADDLAMSLSWVFTNYASFEALSLVIGLIIVRILQELHVHTTIKWPNDIFKENKKLAGILIDTVAKNNNIYTIIGIGINLKTPTNSSTQIGLDLDIIDKYILAQKILKEIPTVLSTLQQYGFIVFHDEWAKHDYLKNKLVIVNNKENSIVGYAQGVNNHGHLMLNVNGEKKQIISGSITIID